MFRKVLSLLSRNLFNRKLLIMLNRLKKMRRISELERIEYQKQKLRTIVNLIPNIPYYSDKNISLETLTYEEFRKIPVLTKEIIRNTGDKLINGQFEQVSSVRTNTSGGSTGEPVRFFRTYEQSLFGSANYHFANFLNGVDIFDSSIDLWGAERDMHNSNGKFDLKSYLYNYKTLNTFVLSDEIIQRYVNILNKERPKFIKAYVHSIYDMSKFINSRGLKMGFTPIIHCTTGPLYSEMRQEIRKAFNGAHVFSFYGSREVSAIATEELNVDGFSVLFDNVFVEILDEFNQPVQTGYEGEVVVTTLNNHYMPLIRYKIGDRAIKGDDLKFGSLKLENIVGRTLGVVLTKDGRRIDGQFFTTLFFNKDGIKNFQLIQKSLSHIIINVIKGESFHEEELRSIIDRISIELGDIDVEVKFCDTISLTKSGKIMYVYSEIV